MREKTNLEDLQKHIDVEEVLDHYNFDCISKVGSNLNGHCILPDHLDDAPSFGINIRSGLWNCFACDSSGNIFTLIKEIEKYTSFWDAVDFLKTLTKYKGFVPSLEHTEALMKKFNTPKKREVKQEIREIRLPKDFKNATKYMSKVGSRVSLKMVKKFNIHFAIKGFYKGGMVIPIQFRKEIVGFFVRDVIGKLDKSKQYNKGVPIREIFFNWDNAIKNPDYVVLTEGMIDCMKVDSFGHNSMAILGIQVGLKKKILLISKFEKIYIALDNDNKIKNGKEHNPGQIAAKTIAESLRSEIQVFNILLPCGKDPDDCSKEEFEIAFKSARKM